VAIIVPLAAVVPPAEQLLFALATLGFTVAFGCAMGALVFYRLGLRSHAATGGAHKDHHVPTHHPVERPAPQPTLVMPMRAPPPATASGAARPNRAMVPDAVQGRETRGGPVANEKQARRFEKLLSNLEREHRQGTVSDPVYRRLRREYRARLDELRSGR